MPLSDLILCIFLPTRRIFYIYFMRALYFVAGRVYLIYYAWMENPIKWSDFNLQHEDKLQPNGRGLVLLQVWGGGGREKEQRIVGKDVDV